jgi:hypothetical protein
MLAKIFKASAKNGYNASRMALLNNNLLVASKRFYLQEIPILGDNIKETDKTTGTGEVDLWKQ